MKFFKPEDFSPGFGTWNGSREEAAEWANKKLEKEGQKVDGFITRNGFPHIEFSTGYSNTTHKALLINIEPIEVCDHIIGLFFNTITLNGIKSMIASCNACGKQFKVQEL